MAERNVILMDLDGTLIKTKSRRVFPKDYEDWQLNKPVISFIEKYTKSLYNPIFIIVTNQMGIERGHVDTVEFSLKLQNIEKELPFKINHVIVADTAKSEFRKPKIDGITKLLRSMNVSLSDKSCMVGDAGGRLHKDGRKKDFSDSDLRFAENLGILFFHTDDCRN